MLRFTELLLKTAVLGIVLATQAHAQPAWKPERQVEIILPTAAGGGNDTAGRLMQKMLQEQKLVTVPVVVVNKAGGNQALSAAYLQQHPGDPHYLLLATSTFITNQMQGLVQYQYTDFPPL